MAYKLVYEPIFRRDYKRVVSLHPQVREELIGALRELEASGSVSEQYKPHLLVHPGGN
jgi:mRNA-degrading endonuclease YafQ of YafQ-DinJ toxin-antitoxin module